MYSIMYNYKGNWIHTYNSEFIPPITNDTIIDILDVHYNVSRIVFQPEQKRFKVFLEQV